MKLRSSQEAFSARKPAPESSTSTSTSTSSCGRGRTEGCGSESPRRESARSAAAAGAGAAAEAAAAATCACGRVIGPATRRLGDSMAERPYDSATLSLHAAPVPDAGGLDPGCSPLIAISVGSNVFEHTF